jgi:glutamate racemase
MQNSITSLPIGVFDSGVGGLTVLRALLRQMPDERFLYLGDTARLPYGTKSASTITQYALQAAQLLVARGVKCLVIACNTASAIALERLREQFAPLVVLGVIDPGADAGCRESLTGRIAVIGTESTIQGGAYQRAIKHRRADAQVTAKPCPLFVALAEEGLIEGSITEEVARHYLGGMFSQGAASPDTLVLGCTHFPVLAPTLRRVLGASTKIVDSAQTTAEAVESALRNGGLLNPASHSPGMQLLATDSPARFARVGSLFLGQTIQAPQVELVDLLLSPTSAR